MYLWYVKFYIETTKEYPRTHALGTCTSKRVARKQGHRVIIQAPGLESVDSGARRCVVLCPFPSM